jgi:hypothetical protein
MNIRKIIYFLLLSVLSEVCSFAKYPLQSTFGGKTPAAVRKQTASLKAEMGIFVKTVSTELAKKDAKELDTAKLQEEIDRYTTEGFIGFLINNEKNDKRCSRAERQNHFLYKYV